MIKYYIAQRAHRALHEFKRIPSKMSATEIAKQFNGVIKTVSTIEEEGVFLKTFSYEFRLFCDKEDTSGLDLSNRLVRQIAILDLHYDFLHRGTTIMDLTPDLLNIYCLSFLIPTNVFKDKHLEMWGSVNNLAEYFEVTPAMIVDRLQFIVEQDKVYRNSLDEFYG